MKRYRIEPGWRYTLAQKVLAVLFGRPWHYISPWMKAGTATCIVPICRDKILLARRAGEVEFAGCWSAIGGFVEVQRGETFPQAAVREFYEETGLPLKAEQFPPSPLLTYIKHGQYKIEEANASVVVGYYPVSIENATEFSMKLAAQPETSDFAWFTEEECLDMIELGKIPHDFEDLHQAIRTIFRMLKEQHAFPTLKV